MSSELAEDSSDLTSDSNVLLSLSNSWVIWGNLSSDASNLASEVGDGSKSGTEVPEEIKVLQAVVSSASIHVILNLDLASIGSVTDLNVGEDVVFGIVVFDVLHVVVHVVDVLVSDVSHGLAACVSASASHCCL